MRKLIFSWSNLAAMLVTSESRQTCVIMAPDCLVSCGTHDVATFLYNSSSWDSSFDGFNEYPSNLPLKVALHHHQQPQLPFSLLSFNTCLCYLIHLSCPRYTIQFKLFYQWAYAVHEEKSGSLMPEVLTYSFSAGNSNVINIPCLY